ncbi:unnamed protein product [Rotaria sordida]|uniref:Uncharacterized protein n=1 Tax=Rotaria sordida TaxID=392033 RepID=A0A814PZB8_9BILA|nr:unnamed protein product [Rotaria sordida]CAF1565924.1 unnamed protein product [Rotaria sordida]
MASKNFFIVFIFLITWTCFIETTLAAAGWCYECDSRNPSCQFNVDPVALAGHKTPCNGQCYIRVKGGVMSRGCSWEYGFMTKQVSYTPTFQQEAMWVFCDTSLCNGNANVSS